MLTLTHWIGHNLRILGDRCHTFVIWVGCLQRNRPSKISFPTDIAVLKVEAEMAGGSQADDWKVEASMAWGFDSSNGVPAIMSILYDHIDLSDHIDHIDQMDPTIISIISIISVKWMLQSYRSDRSDRSCDHIYMSMSIWGNLRRQAEMTAWKTFRQNHAWLLIRMCAELGSKGMPQTRTSSFLNMLQPTVRWVRWEPSSTPLMG